MHESYVNHCNSKYAQSHKINQIRSIRNVAYWLHRINSNWQRREIAVRDRSKGCRGYLHKNRSLIVFPKPQKSLSIAAFAKSSRFTIGPIESEI